MRKKKGRHPRSSCMHGRTSHLVDKREVRVQVDIHIRVPPIQVHSSVLQYIHGTPRTVHSHPPNTSGGWVGYHSYVCVMLLISSEENPRFETDQNRGIEKRGTRWKRGEEREEEKEIAHSGEPMVHRSEWSDWARFFVWPYLFFFFFFFKLYVTLLYSPFFWKRKISGKTSRGGLIGNGFWIQLELTTLLTNWYVYGLIIMVKCRKERRLMCVGEAQKLQKQLQCDKIKLQLGRTTVQSV